MGTISSALSLITGALEADQAALNVVANNVANASNTTYTRQVANWQENQPVYVNGTAYGTGVTMTGWVSQRDRVLNQRLQQQQQASASASSLLSALTTTQTSFTVASGTSTSGDIGTDITSFFNSLTQLEASPTSNPLRQQVLSTATTLASDISGASASLSAQQSSLNQSITSEVSQVNTLTASLAQVSQQIQSTSPNQDAGVLEDQRQNDLSQLAQLIGINQVTTENNGMSVTTTAGQLLATSGNSFALTTGMVGGVAHIYLNGTDITTALASGGGQISGQLMARDQVIPSTLSSLDQLAYSISTQVNTVNNAGTDMAGDNGGAGNIFTPPPTVAGSAASMSVVMTDPSHIAAAGLGNGTGDNSNMVTMANLGTQSIVNGQTPSNYYSNIVSTLGNAVSAATTESTALSALVTQLQNQVSALSSVNLNDEASSMQQFERSYQAASQVFTILNTVMASALNIGVETAVA
uniref:Putative Flagellar hook-associated protein FlgK n=1 Tax=mine drainage metagenome TaxID=410659 RepID=E6PZE2_9ZZZZ